ncbi:hypothetical protein JTE90_004954 [Oedothorax gibbosus]|uniref:Uncharacterized protein n=1 Tax=Oedothorax gibbosus TaxID=931172 RepID=A0AAV6VA01_9ARAC|nr:hypothetical protein JTE90_004954 [Oedothorax gibbosus]
MHILHQSLESFLFRNGQQFEGLPSNEEKTSACSIFPTKSFSSKQGLTSGHAEVRFTNLLLRKERYLDVTLLVKSKRLQIKLLCRQFPS